MPAPAAPVWSAAPGQSHAADRVTLYASDSDYALRSSQFFHGAPRAGSAGAVIIRVAGLDTIDMSAVPADMLGHSYFAANSGAITNTNWPSFAM